MDSDLATTVERIQTLAATILATHPVGHQLCLIGGFRYRLLNASARTSTDIDYHWEGDLQRKQMEIVDVLRSKLLPEVKRQFGYDGDIRPGGGPEAESPAVRTVETAFYRVANPEAASRSRLRSPRRPSRCAAGSHSRRHGVPDGVGCGHDREQDHRLPQPAILPGARRSGHLPLSGRPAARRPRAFVAKTERLALPLADTIGKLDRLANESDRPRARDRAAARRTG